MAGWLVSNTMWHDIFALGAPVVEKMFRPVVVYIFLVVSLRVFGKRELAQLNPFDLVVLAVAFEYGAERHHRQRQLAYGRPNRRVYADGDELSGRPLPVQASSARSDLRREAGSADRRWMHTEGSAGQGVALQG